MRHRAGNFLGELNLLTGQTVFVTAVVTKPLHYVAVDRDTLRTHDAHVPASSFAYPTSRCGRQAG